MDKYDEKAREWCAAPAIAGAYESLAALLRETAAEAQKEQAARDLRSELDHMDDENMLLKQRNDARAENAALRDMAAQSERNVAFWRGIVTQIGEPFGVAARTSDDGSVQDSVLALKVPELVDALRVACEEAKRSDRTTRQECAETLSKLQAQVNAMREALAYARRAAHGPTCDCDGCAEADYALASTPEQSLAAHAREVIERCAKVAESLYAKTNGIGIAAAIRALADKEEGEK